MSEAEESYIRDPSFWAVILGNFISIVMAYVQQWPLYEIMWVYWSQSVVIGIINVIRMLSLKEFTTKGMTMNDAPVPETQEGKRGVATFFTFHYGFFHFGYAVFLWQEMPLNELPADDLAFLILAILTFISIHGYSFRHNFAADFKQQKPNLGTLMFYPYLRILPMHLVIITGGMMGHSAILTFMVLKTLADGAMHLVEHRLFRKAAKSRL
ncbi:MAG: hypothetical protein H6853_05905 [Rhodospirillales bacterium]|nr:hypothetical protein [Alphaproteobacteria bacterium]USO03077.1 MAG: hypothetical protein H6853_05905 [Rhodospirillales bacterium]